MNDREKLIKGMECCIRTRKSTPYPGHINAVEIVELDPDCDECPFHFTNGDAACQEFADLNVDVPWKLIRNVLDLLEEREVKMTVCKICGLEFPAENYSCPRCGFDGKGEPKHGYA